MSRIENNTRHFFFFDLFIAFAFHLPISNTEPHVNKLKKIQGKIEYLQIY